MDISVTEFKARCLDLIRQVEKGGEPVIIKRRGKIVAQLEPPKKSEQELSPWERVRAEVAGTMCHFEPGESVLHDEDFEALR
jgi:prevent-host-death family protein